MDCRIQIMKLEWILWTGTFMLCLMEKYTSVVLFNIATQFHLSGHETYMNNSYWFVKPTNGHAMMLRLVCVVCCG
jgi:hypothetical protein